ncbi:carbonic anhydrase [Xylaria cf. heliscus]|nr:carbonic anhydrase [Xylaria cf. heliscus]
MTSSFTSEILRRAEVVSKDHKPYPYLSEVAHRPKKMIFCCFDQRVIPEHFLQLSDGDDVLLMRTASGTPARNMIDIATIDRLAGLTEVIVIKHTDCGATYITEHDVREHIIKHNPDLAGTLDDLDLQSTTNMVERTRLDVELIKSSPYVRKDLREKVSGLLYDVKTGSLTKIV